MTAPSATLTPSVVDRTGTFVSPLSAVGGEANPADDRRGDPGPTECVRSDRASVAGTRWPVRCRERAAERDQSDDQHDPDAEGCPVDRDPKVGFDPARGTDRHQWRRRDRADNGEERTGGADECTFDQSDRREVPLAEADRVQCQPVGAPGPLLASDQLSDHGGRGNRGENGEQCEREDVRPIGASARASVAARS